jgi:hypothetical protein
VPIAFHPSWPAPAQTLLCRAIDRHGGWSLWNRLEAVTIHLVSLRGLLPWVKGYGRSFQLARSVTAFPKTVRAEWNADTGEPCLATFDHGDMRLFDPATGRVQVESLDHRRTFAGTAKKRRWDALDAHYFFGYAFASYTAMPFTLPGLRYLEAVDARWHGERLSGVRVEFPVDAQVHSRVQTYLFDATGLLRRNDYVADVVGAWAVGAHFWEDYTTVEGLPLPARRTVVRRIGNTPLPFATALAATFDRMAVRLGPTEPVTGSSR